MRHPRLVLAIFILSGAAGLMYEVVWSRQLVLVFGNTTQAVSTILTGFFGGMAIGSFVGGRLADRVRSPLRLYGVIELVLVAVVVATPLTFRLLHEVYRGAYPALEGSLGAIALLRFVLAILALAPATILMGATLPALTRQLTRRRPPLERLRPAVRGEHARRDHRHVRRRNRPHRAARADGHAAGRRAPAPGSPGIVALRLARDARPVSPPVNVHAEPPRDSRPRGLARPQLALALAFVSGLTSLGYQVLWTRLLSSGTGNSTYVFTLILGTFLIGIALGAAAFTRFRPRIGRPVAAIAVAQVIVALLAFAGLVFVIGRPGPLDPSRPLESAWAILGPMFLVVLPTTFVMGFTFPASSALLGDDPERIASSAGSLLAANTFGAIVATFAIPFLVIPAVGSPVAVAILAVVNVGTALVLLALASGVDPARRAATAAVAAVTGLAILAAIVTPRRARRSRRGARPPGRRDDLRVGRGRDRLGPGRARSSPASCG